jgi:hypothetical protein
MADHRNDSCHDIRVLQIAMKQRIIQTPHLLRASPLASTMAGTLTTCLAWEQRLVNPMHKVQLKYAGGSELRRSGNTDRRRQAAVISVVIHDEGRISRRK